MQLGRLHPSVQKSVLLRLPRYLPRKGRHRRRICERFAFDLATVIWRYRSCFLLDDFAIDVESLSSLITEIRLNCSAIPDLEHIVLLQIDGEALFVGNRIAMIERLQNGLTWLPSIVLVDVNPILSEPKILDHENIIDEFLDIMDYMVSALKSDAMTIKVAFQNSKLSLSSICALLLEYPVCYILQKDAGNSFRPNCLGNIPLLVFDVALKIGDEIYTAFSYSCPAEFCDRIASDYLKAQGFVITSKAVSAPMIPL